MAAAKHYLEQQHGKQVVLLIGEPLCVCGQAACCPALASC